ncbi:hypothetical protein NMY22_g12415 [Coprinellus aureogranulatus]|nr:hypothetical protein NMY22_g12415 [Coprinellus aureogranulatus]
MDSMLPGKSKARKSTLGTLAIPPINPNIAAPISTPQVPPTDLTSTETAPAPKPSTDSKPKHGRPSAGSKAKATKASTTKKAQEAKSTKAVTARNLYLIEYRDKHGPVSTDEFNPIWDAVKNDPAQIVMWEKKAWAAKEEAKEKIQKKPTRAAKKAAPAEPVGNSIEDKASPIEEPLGEDVDEPAEEDEEDEEMTEGI